MAPKLTQPLGAGYCALMLLRARVSESVIDPSAVTLRTPDWKSLIAWSGLTRLRGLPLALSTSLISHGWPLLTSGMRQVSEPETVLSSEAGIGIDWGRRSSREARWPESPCAA